MYWLKIALTALAFLLPLALSLWEWRNLKKGAEPDRSNLSVVPDPEEDEDGPPPDDPP